MYLYPKPRKKTVMPVDYELRIPAAAIKVFAQKGYTSTTMSDVSIQAKVGIGTLYNYFRNKDDLLLSCMKKTIDDEIQQLRELCEKESDPMDKLHTFFVYHAELIKSKPYIAKFLVVELRQSENFYKRNPSYNPLNYYINYVREIFAGAMQSGRIKTMDLDALSYMVVGAMDMVMTQWLISGKSLDVVPLINKIRQILKEGITPA